MNRPPRRTVLVSAATTAVIMLAGCSQTTAAVENTLDSHLGTPLESFPGITDDHYTLSLTQDVRIGSVPRAANQVSPSDTGWTIVGICADTPIIDIKRTKNVTIRVVSSQFIDGPTLAAIAKGSMQDGVVCGNAAPLSPDLDAAQ